MKFKLSLIWLLLIISGSCFGQTTIDSLIKKLDNYAARHPKEKVHVQLDKETYAAGENIWMKLYCIVSPENLLSNISKVAYIDLIAPNNKLIKSIKIPLASGLGIGDFALSETITEGSYRVRAYTQWMRNDTSAYFFDKTVHIVNGRADNVITSDQIIVENGKKYYAIDLKTLSGNPIIETSISYKIQPKNGKERTGREKTNKNGRVLIELKDDQASEKIDLTFKSTNEATIHKTFTLPSNNSQNSLQILPESGTIINQVNTKIGFKVLNKKGLGEKTTIKVFENETEEIASMETNILGMTSFPFILDSNKKYKATATFPDGTQTTTNFPLVTQSGINMSVSNMLDEKIMIQISASPDQIHNEEVYLMLQYNGNVFHVAKQNFKKEEILFSVPRKNIPAGVIQISFLNKNLQPLLERMIFNYRPDKILTLATKTDKESYATRQKVTVSIEAGDLSDSLRVSSLSAAVTNDNKTKSDSVRKTSILTSLLLTSDIQGYIENPQYYFTDSADIKKTELDDLMLIQGWRKLDWLTYSNDSDIPKFYFETGATVSGTIKKLGRKAVVPNAKVMLVPTTNLLGGIDTLSDQDGRFNFDQLIFPDSVKFIITAKTDKGKNNVDIDLDKTGDVESTTAKNEIEIINNINASNISNIKSSQSYFVQLEKSGLMQKYIQLEEAQVNRVVKPKVPAHSNNLNGAGRADQIISEEDLSSCPTLELCLSGRLLGVTFQNGVPYNTRGNVPMQVVLDGMYIEADQLSFINVQDVASVEVLRNSNYTSIYGQYGGNGLIIITTKRGDGALRSFNPTGILTFIPKGFYLNKTFFKPTYETPESAKLASDLRTTIHWESNIIVDKTGKTHFDFYTSDEKGPYTVIIEGVDFTGKIGRKEFKINVN